MIFKNIRKITKFLVLDDKNPKQHPRGRNPQVKNCTPGYDKPKNSSKFTNTSLTWKLKLNGTLRSNPQLSLKIRDFFCFCSFKFNLFILIQKFHLSNLKSFKTTMQTVRYLINKKNKFEKAVQNI